MKEKGEPHISRRGFFGVAAATSAAFAADALLPESLKDPLFGIMSARAEELPVHPELEDVYTYTLPANPDGTVLANGSFYNGTEITSFFNSLPSNPQCQEEYVRDPNGTVYAWRLQCKNPLDVAGLKIVNGKEYDNGQGSFLDVNVGLALMQSPKDQPVSQRDDKKNPIPSPATRDMPSTYASAETATSDNPYGAWGLICPSIFGVGITAFLVALKKNFFGTSTQSQETSHPLSKDTEEFRQTLIDAGCLDSREKNITDGAIEKYRKMVENTRKKQLDDLTAKQDEGWEQSISKSNQIYNEKEREWRLRKLEYFGNNTLDYKVRGKITRMAGGKPVTLNRGVEKLAVDHDVVEYEPPDRVIDQVGLLRFLQFFGIASKK